MAEKRKSLVERLAALDKVSDEVNKKLGKNIAGRLSKNEELRESLVQKYIPSLCHDFNVSTGGGYPRGKCTLIAGIYNSGKTSRTLEDIAYNMKKDPEFTVLLLESEASIDEKMICETFGIDEERFVFLRYDHNIGAEGMIDILESYIRAIDVDMIVVNSLKLMTPTKIMEESVSNQMPAVQAKLWTKMSQKFTSLIAEKGTAFVVITHVYDSIGSYKPVKIISGGSAMQYWASITMIFNRRTVLETDPVSREDGMHIEVSLVKNRLNYRLNRFDYFVIVGKGTEQVLSHLPLLVDTGIVRRKGSYLSFSYEGEEVKCNSKKSFREWMIEHPEHWEFLVAQLPATTTVRSMTDEEAKTISDRYGIEIDDDIEITEKGQ